MRLSVREVDKLRLHAAGALAQKRLARGLKLNYPEAVALIATQVLEFIRDGKSVAELMDLGKQLLGRRNVLPAVPVLLDVVQVEGTFADGTKLVTVHHPISREDGDLSLALHGSFLPVPSPDLFATPVTTTALSGSAAPGQIMVAGTGPLLLNAGRAAVRLSVSSQCDRPIQVGSHYHFVETNPLLFFDRQLAYGYHLNILPGTAVRFEPGETKQVVLVAMGGKRVIRGGNGIASGPVDESRAAEVAAKAVAMGLGHVPEPSAPKGVVGTDEALTVRVERERYADVFGPTVGDRVRLGDTALVVEVEKDFTVLGDECKFGGGKVLREGMGQATGVKAEDALDVIITNALIVDHWGIVKADVGIKGTRIVGIGKGGNPDVMNGVDENMVVGVTTEVIAGEGLILTAGGIDTHVHFICPQLADEAICSGLTTLVGGGTGPAHGTLATTCTPSPDAMALMLQATDNMPLNFGFTGKGNTSSPEGLLDIIKAGAIGLKLHEDWGTTPAAIDTCLGVAEQHDVQVTIHTDTLNESACVEQTIAAFKNRTIHTYHSEGAGGGHAPDIISICGESNVLPSSTNPTRPFTTNTIDEHLDMLMVCHHLDSNNREDVAFAESRIRAETIAAEDILHDMGAISMMSSDSQAMGRIGEVITRTWQTAHKMKVQRGPLNEDKDSEGFGFGTAPNDNFRVKRYVAKYTINPAIAHGFSHMVGSVEVGKMADLVLWRPAFFGAKPEIVVKGGAIAWAQMGDANASIPTPEPVIMRPQFAASGKAVGGRCLAFVSQLCQESGSAANLGLTKTLTPVHNCRNLCKEDMIHNGALPAIHVDPETYQVTADGAPLTCQETSSMECQGEEDKKEHHQTPPPLPTDWAVWQLLDSLLPAGGFAHSLGLEAAARAGFLAGTGRGAGRGAGGAGGGTGGAGGEAGGAGGASGVVRGGNSGAGRGGGGSGEERSDMVASLRVFVLTAVHANAALLLPFVATAHGIASASINASACGSAAAAAVAAPAGAAPADIAVPGTMAAGIGAGTAGGTASGAATAGVAGVVRAGAGSNWSSPGDSAAFLFEEPVLQPIVERHVARGAFGDALAAADSCLNAMLANDVARKVGSYGGMRAVTMGGDYGMTWHLSILPLCPSTECLITPGLPLTASLSQPRSHSLALTGLALTGLALTASLSQPRSHSLALLDCLSAANPFPPPAPMPHQPRDCLSAATRLNLIGPLQAAGMQREMVRDAERIVAEVGGEDGGQRYGSGGGGGGDVGGPRNDPMPLCMDAACQRGEMEDAHSGGKGQAQGGGGGIGSGTEIQSERRAGGEAEREAGQEAGAVRESSSVHSSSYVGGADAEREAEQEAGAVSESSSVHSSAYVGGAEAAAVAATAATAAGAGVRRGGMDWTGVLVVELVGGRSTATRSFCRYPLKIMVPSKVAASGVDAVWAYIITYGGGIVAGDKVTLSCAVQCGATAVFASQASTKIFHSMPGTPPARQLITATIQPGALLAVLPEPITCFRASQYQQLQSIHVAPGGSLVLVDWLTSGRRDRGEVWEMECYESCNRVYREGEEIPLVFDKVKLSANAVVPPGQQLEGIHVLTTIIVLGPRTEAVRAHLKAAVAQAAAAAFNPRRSSRGYSSSASSPSPSATSAPSAGLSGGVESTVWGCSSDMGHSSPASATP
ncbi:unnamed protein product [Closterium sp. NIES-64]|nr:unnamed protein product [Closterium sp. NIES-64]